MHYLMEGLEGVFLMVRAGLLYSRWMEGKAHRSAFFVAGFIFILRRNNFWDGKTDCELIRYKIVSMDL